MQRYLVMFTCIYDHALRFLKLYLSSLDGISPEWL